MNKYLSVLLLEAIIAAACCNNHSSGNKNETNNNEITKTIMCKTATSEELTGIRKALDLYVQAAIKGNSKIARPAFAEGATISHAENDSLICLPIQALFDYYDEIGRASCRERV